MRTKLLTSIIALVGILFAASVQARTIYVDSRVGSNAYDGTAAQPLNAYVGPVKTLARAMQLVEEGDTLVLVDNGVPYYGSITLFGSRFSGSPAEPFRLLGNGAVISGAKPLPSHAWQEVGFNLWRITPLRKGGFQLIQNGAALSRIPLTSEADLANLSAGSWGELDSAIYYRSEMGDNPRWHEFDLAVEQTGLSLLHVRNAVISNVTFQHFRGDGINAHDGCSGVVLDGVRCVENGRAGLAVGGTCRLSLQNSQVAGNHQHSLIVTQFGEVSASQVDFDQQPTIVE